MDAQWEAAVIQWQRTCFLLRRFQVHGLLSPSKLEILLPEGTTDNTGADGPTACLEIRKLVQAPSRYLNKCTAVPCLSELKIQSNTDLF